MLNIIILNEKYIFKDQLCVPFRTHTHTHKASRRLHSAAAESTESIAYFSGRDLHLDISRDLPVTLDLPPCRDPPPLPRDVPPPCLSSSVGQSGTVMHLDVIDASQSARSFATDQSATTLLDLSQSVVTRLPSLPIADYNSSAVIGQTEVGGALAPPPPPEVDRDSSDGLTSFC